MKNLKQRLMQITEELRQLAEEIEVTAEPTQQESAPEITLEEVFLQTSAEPALPLT